VSLLVSAARSTASLTVHLVDVSPAALDLATRTLNAYDVKVERHQASYEAGLEALSRHHGRRTLVLFLGSNVGNFDPPGAAEFLRTIRRALQPDDALLIGADLLKPERDLLLAYDDPLGVTSCLQPQSARSREPRARRRLRHRRLRASRDLERGRIARRNASRQYAKSARPYRGIPPGRDAAGGETIWTESSYKVSSPEILAMLTRAGFRELDQ
jgi:uncharacterized SAM-dependent methyltransferase